MTYLKTVCTVEILLDVCVEAIVQSLCGEEDWRMTL